MSEKKLSFWPWSRSATGNWGEDTGLKALRDFAKGDMEAAELAEGLWAPGIGVQNSAICELFAHGNIRQAAKLARTLVEQHPVTRKSLMASFSGVADTLFNSRLEDLPSKPSEYPPNVEKEFIQ